MLDLRPRAKVYAGKMAQSGLNQNHLTVGKLAELAEVSANAVRFYEREGLMQVPLKTQSGYRLYGPEAVQRLRFIKQAQHCGFTLTEVHALLQLRDQPSACCSEVRDKVIEKKLALEARIRDMKTLSKALDRLIADCSNDGRPAEDCAILAALCGQAPGADR